MTKEQKSWMLKGAAMERKAILARIRRMIRNDEDGESLVTWILRRHDRYNKRKGGLGR